MKTLYFQEPKIEIGGPTGGVRNVAYNLPRALAKRIEVTYFPIFVPRRNYAVRLLNVFRRLAIGDFEIVHFNHSPFWTQGGSMLLKFAETRGASTILNVHGIIPIEIMLENLRATESWLTLYDALSTALRNCKIADKVVTYSEFMRTNIVNWYGVNRDKIAVIPNGVDLRKFSQITGELSLEGDPSVLYLGGITKFKSVDLLIEAISRLQPELPKIKLHLAGPIYGGLDKTALEQLAKTKEVENHVVFHGDIAPEMTPQYYKAAEICVFPSRRDSAGITLLEAMASGTPVIASNRGGTPEIVTQGENAIFFEPEDPDSLPKAILTLHQDSVLRKTLSNNALKTAAKYSWENIAEKYISLYRSLRERKA